MEAEACCFICYSSKPPLICPLCFEKYVGGFRELLHAYERKAQLADQLEAAVLAKEKQQKHLGTLASLRDSLLIAGSRTQAARTSKEEAGHSTRQLQSSNARRRSELESCTDEVRRKEGSQTKAQAELKSMMLRQYGFRTEALEELQRKVRTLLGAVPFKLDLSKDANKGLPGVYIGGILMPTPLKSPVGTKERQRLSTALGNLVLLVQWLAALVGAPLLHHLEFSASTSRMWMQRSFRNEKRQSQSAVYRLYHASTVPSPSAPQGSPIAPSAAGTALAAIRQHWPFDAAFKAAPAAPPTLQLSDRRQEEDLSTAIFQLFRNAGLLCNDPLLNFWGKPPKDWTPVTTLATLAGLCARMRQPPRSDGRLSMATSLAQLSSAGGLEGSSFVDPFGNDDDDREADEEVDGWDMVQRPVGWAVASQRSAEALRMPPPPSDADATHHWERAMITDSNARPARLPTNSQKLLEQLVPLGHGAYAGATAAADKGLRLWRGLRRGT